MPRRIARGRTSRSLRRERSFCFERLEERALLAVSPALLNSWFVSGQGQFAKVYVGQPGGTVVGPSTTWTTQSSQVIGDVQKVSFSNSTNTVYVNTPDLASYVMGAWWGDAAHTTPFQNLPKDQNAIYKIKLNETYPSVTHSLAGGGAVGIAVNGVSLFNTGDAFSYSHATSSEVGPPSGDGLFNRLAAAVEAVTFDVGNGHQPGNGEYHYHEDPIALRAQLDDNVDYVGTTNYFPYDPAVYYLTRGEGLDGDFSERTTGLHHSAIIGWAFDGYPIYGPYGYSDPNDPNSAITRMESSFALRSITTRTTLPGWAAQLSGAKLGTSATGTSADGVYTMTPTQQSQYAGPAVSANYPLGRYGEDYAYTPGSGNLDQFNGRWCRTPEFPNGTYAYFTTIDAAGEPAFPYIIGRQYYGQTNGSGKVGSITESVTVSFNLATNTAPVVSGPAAFSVKQSAFASLAGSLQFSVSDIDEATVESVALAVTTGTLALDLTGPLASRVSIVSGGNHAGAVTISGAVDELNAALATLTYTAPSSGGSATLTVQANDGSAANNLSSAFGTTITIDATNVSIAIASSASTLNAGQTATITFSLSAAATNFTVADVSVTGGALSGFAGSGATYSATFTPTPGSTTPGTLSVAAGAFTNAAGTPNAAGSLSTPILIDTVAPTIAITSSASALRAGQTATITFTLSEASTNFTASGVTVTGGTLAGFAGSGASYSATFTPTANSTGVGTVSVAAAAFTDAAGNPNTAGSLAPSITIDTVAPTISIQSSVSSLTAGSTANITFVLSKASTDFTAADVAVTGGALSGFTGAGTSYSAIFTPAVTSVAPGTVSVAANAFTDAAGNPNTAGSLAPSISIDTVRPTVVINSSALALKVGQTATIGFSLSAAATNFTVADVSVTGGALSGFAGSGATYSATFTPTPGSTTPGTLSVAAGAFTNAAGTPNAAGSLSTPILIDTVAPTIAITSSASALRAGQTATITFTLSEASTNFTASGVTVTGGTLAGFAGSGLSYSCIFTPTANSTGAGTVSVAAAAFTSAAGNPNAAGSLAPSITIDTVAPTISITGNKATLKAGETSTYTFTLSKPSTTFTASDVYATNGTVSGFTAISSTVYTCTFTPKPDFTGTGYVVVYDNTFTDLAGNGNRSPNSYLISFVSIDTFPPTAQISSSKTSLGAGEASIYTITLSKPSTTFTASDVYPVNGTVSAFTAISSTVYTCTYTPAANFAGTGYVVVYDNTFTDLAGNGNKSANGYQISYVSIDTVQPTAQISSSKTSLGAGESSTYTITLSKPSTTFTASDVYATNGTVSGFTAISSTAISRTVYTCTYTPNTNFTGTGYVVVYDNTFTDLAGNGNTSANGYLISFVSIDTVVPPTVSITSGTTSLKAGDTTLYTFTLSAPSSTFTASDVYPTNGTVSGFTALSSTAYTCTFTPKASFTGTGYVVVYDNTFTDSTGHGNRSPTGSTISTLAIDTVVLLNPTLTITGNMPNLKAGETATYTFTLSKPSTNFTASDVQVLYGTLSSFTKVSSTVYTAKFTPNLRTTNTGFVRVNDGTFTDSLGNANKNPTGSGSVISSVSIDTAHKR